MMRDEGKIGLYVSGAWEVMKIGAFEGNAGKY